tara:strand:- start:4368 stop:4502 length:135 start_codon:yes stop_codon:yes gene_type:complete
MKEITITILECKRCGYEWQSQLDRKPKTCTKCKRYDWDETKDGK